MSWPKMPLKEPRYIIDPITGCWLWQLYKNKDGYGSVSTRIKGKSFTYRAHIVEYEKKYGPVPEGKELDHKCKIKHCVNPDHLKAVTKIENLYGRSTTKLTTEQVEEIRRLP